MFNIGDLIIYSAHGVCRIDDICEKTYMCDTKYYYDLHPIENCKLKISIPIDNDKVIMMDLIDNKEAEEIVESFKLPGVRWIEFGNERTQKYSDMVKSGDRKEISMIINTLMRMKHKAEMGEKKFHEKDSRLLNTIQNILFIELAMSLNTTFDAINEKITNFIKEYEYEIECY
jgi:CarD family transcriptional regulator